ncbi:MAG TPA: aldo/keto reductase [Candidatus Sulfotelmatobacter sp.]|nr:aldo/keto reductase [Candidatus Sulfotelmatobacter sp.]
MKYVNFGGRGLKVSQVALGTMTFGTERGVGSTEDESRQIFERYLEIGGNFIDTANTYTEGTSERFVGLFSRSLRQSLVLATKYGLTTKRSDINASGSSRKNLVQSVEDSCSRLGTDYIDLLWLHAWDTLTTPEETLRALDDLIRAGKVLYLGISNAPAWFVVRSNTIAELRGWSAFAGIQAEYSLIERSAELELFPMAQHLNLTPTVWSPLGGGILTGKYNPGARRVGEAPRRLDTFKWLQQADERNLAIGIELTEVADSAEINATHLALAWIKYRFPTAIPLLGVRSVAQLDDNLAFLDLTVPTDVLERVDRINRPTPLFPYSYLQSPLGIGQVYGDFSEHVIHE